VKNEEVLHRAKADENITHQIKRRKGNLIRHILIRSCLLKHVIEGKIGAMRRTGRRHKQLLGDRKKKRRYYKLKEESLDHTLENSL
jgi:hypothetical protein